MKIERRLFNAMSAFAAVREQVISEGFNRLNIECGSLEATNGKGGYQLKLSGAWAKLSEACQILPIGFVPPPGFEPDYPQMKPSRAKDVDLKPISPGSKAYDRGGWRSFSSIKKSKPDTYVRLPVIALESILNFCQSERFDFERDTDYALCLFLSERELTLIQRWQRASRLAVPCLPDQIISPIGQQFLCCLSAELLCRTAELLIELYWQKQQFIELRFSTPQGWNNSFNPERTAGLTTALEIRIDGLDRSGLFESAFIQLSPIQLAEDSIIELNSPQFPIRLGGEKVNLYRN